MGIVKRIAERRQLMKDAARDDPQAIRKLNERHIKKNVQREAKEEARQKKKDKDRD